MPDTGPFEGGQQLADAAAMLVVTNLRGAVDALTPDFRRTIVDHVSAAYRVAWETGYREGLRDATAAAQHPTEEGT